MHLSKFTEELLNFFSSEVKSCQIRLERKCQRAFNAFCANFVLLPELLQNKHGNVRAAVAALLRACVLLCPFSKFKLFKNSVFVKSFKCCGNLGRKEKAIYEN